MFCSEIEMKALLDSLPVPIITFDNNIEIITVNSDAMNMFENSLNIKSKDVKSNIGEWIGADLVNFKNDNTKEILCLEKEFKTNIHGLHFRIKLRKIVEENFQVKKIIVVLNDVTNEKITEMKLKESKEKLNFIIENMPIMMDAIDEKDNIIVWNKECEIVTGYDKEEIKNNPQIWKTVYPDEAYKEKILKQIRELDCNFKDLEYDMVCKDGSVKTISWFNISKKFPIPKWNSWAFGIDVTGRKSTEEKLRRKTKELEKIFEVLPDLYFRINSQGIILDCKSGIHSDFDIVPKEYRGELFNDIVPRDTKMFFNKAIHKVLTTNNLVEEEFCTNDNEQLKYFEGRLVPLTKNEVIIIVRDISKRKLTEEAKKKAEENIKILNEAMEYEKLRTEFFANISHEFRTPLNVILGAIQLMDIYVGNISDSKIYEKIINLKKIMKQNCYRLIRLVNNLIDITSIDAGFLDLNLKNYDIVKIVEDITMSVSEFARLKYLDLEFYSNTNKKIIACDPDKIERIILNLLSNSIKFTKQQGKISVNVTSEEDSIMISVKDSGVGIKKENLDSIFERFIQVNKSLTRENEGSGIGLSLVKLLVEMHDGSISVNSEYEKGSEFIIKLPVKIVEDSNENLFKNIEIDKVEKVSIEFSDIYF
ncbi:PAS domain-containing sensor histidine kinase [Clostridium gasigenes]|uniref:PAS domain-containing sensor histidine kinase n=1 Tax=Clostridium gasigenes TaxID=94869 RepID=UPI001C0B2062|nr:PAS domain-containing sensor histidine kinase [Clostridium gasigenes]MBU3090308.1 PAS domain-containing sensor histidine kinase [Clostridium gasigenes]